MSSLFSAISGALTKPIILGALLPATVFMLIAYLWLFPMIPVDAQALARFADIDVGWKLASLGALSVSIAALLHLFNTAIIRFYEGYPWKNGPMGMAKAARYEARLKALMEARVAGRALRDELKAGSEERSRVVSMLIDIANEITLSFPEPGSVLPTRLGNTIRAFESYPWTQYGIAGIPLWPHFVAKAAATDAGAIDDAKTSVDVAINFSFLLGILALCILAAGFFYPIPFASWALALPWMARSVVLAAASYLAYVASIGSAREWGATVRSVFDRYRASVLKDLGFTKLPASLQEERELWTSISLQISRGDPPDGPALHFTDETYVLPRGAKLVVSRGASAADATLLRTITVSIHNGGTTDVDKVVLHEPIASTSQYIWGTMAVNGNPVTPAGVNPYRIEIGKVTAGSDAVVTYKIGAA